MGFIYLFSNIAFCRYVFPSYKTQSDSHVIIRQSAQKLSQINRFGLAIFRNVRYDYYVKNKT